MRAYKDAFIYALIQATSYCIVTINFRAVASGRIPLALFTDGINASLGFFLVRKLIKMNEADSFIGWVGYLIGSLAGTALGMWIDRS